jgi:hypothetical protein
MLTYLAVFVSRYKPTPPNQDKVIEQMTLLGSSHIYLGRSAFYFRTDIYFQADSNSTYTATFSAVCSDVLLSATGESPFMTISTIFKVVISSHIVSVTLQTWKHHGAFTDNVVPLARGSLFVYSSLVPTENDHRRSCL